MLQETRRKHFKKGRDVSNVICLDTQDKDWEDAIRFDNWEVTVILIENSCGNAGG